MRVAQVIGKLADGGVEAVVNNYYRHTDTRHIQFDYFIDDDSEEQPSREMLERGARYFRVPSSRHLVRRVWALARLFRQNGYAIVHSHMNTLNAPVLFAAKCAGVRVRISHNHSTANAREWKRTALKRLLRVTGGWFATAQMACGEQAGRWFFGDRQYDDGRVKLLPNAIDVSTYQFDAESRRRLREDMGARDKLVVGHAGRFTPQKNHEFLLAVFSAIRESVPDAVLWLIGEGKQRRHIEALADEMGISESVVFMGARDDLAKVYSAMDCFLLPSLYEGVPLVGVEAQAAGLPCFFSDEVSREVALSGDVHFISLKAPPDVWAGAIVGRVPVSDALRMAGADRVRGSAFDLRVSGRMLERLYEALCSGSD